MELSRRNKLLTGLCVTAAILVGRLFYVQIINDRYKLDSSNNSMLYDVIYPTRGIIYDRNGHILAGNKVAYDILVTPREVTEFDTLALASALDVSPDFIREKMQGYRKRKSRIGYQSVVMMKMLPPERYMKFAELQYKFPGFKGQVRSMREYPFNAGGNLLGYVSEVDEDYMEKHPGEYKPRDYAGKTGLEAAREKDLRGEKGYHILLRNSHNQVQDVYKNGEMDKDAVPGKNIVTTIDAQLQQYGQMLMQNKVGSLVAIEPSTGEILTMVSSPGIDVDVLSNIGEHYTQIVSDPYKPMFNRAVQASYPPGSVFKLINGLIGLEEGVLQPSYTYPCVNGYPYGNGHKLGCHGHRSPLDFEDAVMMSCNGYFCYVFKNILENKKYQNTSEAFDRWREYVTSFGLGEKLGSDFPFELGGNVPTSKYYNKIYGKNGWRFSTVISLSIGQGELGITPLQIANICAILANRGYYYTPHLVKDSEGIEIDSKYHERNYTKVDTNHFKKVINGMWLAVNAPPGTGNTAGAAAVPGLDLCGKTGTAQNPRGADNSVFICFAPRDNPRIAVAAYVENAGFGATWACPIASLLVEKYLTGEIREERKAVESRIMEAYLMSRVKKD
ncbi:MAG: penicillin-binding protein 2 [Bacteroidales bacterium]|nr:penicillin-binding protein 2 [Bacteroidales bacterium]